MSRQRLLLVVVLLASVAAVLSSQPKRNDVIVGHPGPWDHLVHHERFTLKSKWFQILKQQKTFNSDYGRNISAVKLLDQKGNGATASVVAGGPGFNYVTVKFRSVRGHGIDYIVEFFGR